MRMKAKSLLEKIRMNRVKNSIITSKWLKKLGVSSSLASVYTQNNDLHRIADGAFFYPGDTLTWASGVATIQNEICEKAWIGGITAVKLITTPEPMHHHIKNIELFSPVRMTIPRWVQADIWSPYVIETITTKLFTNIHASWSFEEEIADNKLIFSVLEKSLIELCFLVPRQISFSEAVECMKHIKQLDTKRLQSILENCRNYKAIKIFLYIGKMLQHNWYQKLDLSKIDIGQGNHLIGSGHFDAELKITVPHLK